MRNTFWVLLLLLTRLPLQSSQDTLPFTSHDDLPPLIQLTQLFDDVQGGPPQSFPRWPQDIEDLNVLKTSIITFQEVIQKDIERLENIPDPRISDFFISDTLKFSVLAPNSFQQHLETCGVRNGYLPYGMHLLNNAIHQSRIPAPIFISQKPIFKSADVLKWAAIIDQNANSCAIWQLTAIGTPEVRPEADCNSHMHSICIQAAGNQSYFNLLMNQNAIPQLLTFTKFLNYLLSQISSLEAPESKYASDIGMHLSQSATYYAENIEREGLVSYAMLAAAQHSVNLLLLALTKSQHSSFWQTENLQQSNFDKIQSTWNQNTRFLAKLVSRVEAQIEQNKRKGRQMDNGANVSTVRPTQQEGSGVEDHHQASSPSTAQPFTSSTSPPLPPHNHQDRHDRHHHDNQNNRHNATNVGNDNNDDNNARHDDNRSNQNDDNRSNQNDENQPDSPSMFSWVYWFGQSTNTNNQTLPSNATDDNYDNITSVNIQGQGAPDGFPFDIYMNWDIIRFWPFTHLIPFARFHLLALIEFYINLIWKCLTLALAVYVGLLSRRVRKLEIKCNSLDQAANVQMFNLNQNQIKHLSSTHAKRNRQHGPHVPNPVLKDDPQSVKPLLKH